MLLAQSTQPIHMKDEDMVEFYRQARRVSRERRQSKPTEPQTQNNEHRAFLWPFSSTLNRTPIRRKSAPRPTSTINRSTTPPLRLADVAKQHVMATHVDNWREDMISVQQHLPLQHIIGSLKRDRDEPLVVPHQRSQSSSKAPSLDGDTCRMTDVDSTSHYSSPQTPTSPADSFLDLLRTPQSMPFSPEPDLDRRFSYQAPEHIAKDISQAALPGLNMALNLATITAEERDLFSEYAPRQLDDPHLLMDQVRRMRDLMMNSKEVLEDPSRNDEEACEDDEIPTSRDEDVAKDFDIFVDYQ